MRNQMGTGHLTPDALGRCACNEGLWPNGSRVPHSAPVSRLSTANPSYPRLRL